MAKKKKVELDYVASTLKINYTIPKGLVHLLSKLAMKPEKEVWCMLSELTNVCAHRLSTNEDEDARTWTSKEFPGSEVTLRIDMTKRTWNTYDKVTKLYTLGTPQYHAKIKIAGQTDETFTQTQINDYITEKILLGDDEDEAVTQGY